MKIKQYIRCQLCDGLAFLMGVLGKLAWYRCEGCGMEFSKRLK